MSVLKEVQDNSVETLDLVMDPDHDDYGSIRELVQALESNTSITSISLKKDFLGALFGKDRISILTAVGSLKNIQEVELGDAGVMVEGIVSLTKSAKTLRKLTLQNLILQGVQKDFDGLEAVLHAHPALKEFEMNDCTPAVGDIDIGKVENAGKSIQNNTTIDNPSKAAKNAIAA